MGSLAGDRSLGDRISFSRATIGTVRGAIDFDASVNLTKSRYRRGLIKQAFLLAEVAAWLCGRAACGQRLDASAKAALW
jgi:hypothetical protein